MCEDEGDCTGRGRGDTAGEVARDVCDVACEEGSARGLRYLSFSVEAL